MAGALRKTMIYLGLADGDEHYEAEQAPSINKGGESPADLERELENAPAPVAEPAAPKAGDDEYRAL